MLEIAFWGQNQNSYNQAKNMLEKYRNIILGTDSILKVTEYVGKIVFEEDCIESQNTYNNIANISTVEKEKTKEILYGSIDGCAVNTRIEDENSSTWIRTMLNELFSDAIQILDKFHLL